MKYLGITIKKAKSISKVNIIDAIGRLFLSAELSATQAKKIIGSLWNSDEELYAEVVALTESHISALKSESLSESERDKKLQAKIKDWVGVFGNITEADFASVKARFGIPSNAYLVKPGFDSPVEMAEYLKSVVKGQDDAVSKFAVPLFMHYLRVRRGAKLKIKPVLLCGESGCGKTEMAYQAKQICGCLFISVNCSEISGNSWRGLSLADILLTEISKHGKEEVEHAVIFVDEFDKLAKFERTKDDCSYDVQREFLNYTDGRGLPVHLGSLADAANDKLAKEISPENIFFIFAGAFQGMQDIVRKRVNIVSKVGFNHGAAGKCDVPVFNEYDVEGADLIRYGLMPELVGRVGSIITMKTLDADGLYEILKLENSILTEHADCMKQLYDVDLCFSDEALMLICRHAAKQGLGYRSVQSVVAACVNPLYYNPLEFNLTSGKSKKKKIVIDEQYVAQQLKIKQYA